MKVKNIMLRRFRHIQRMDKVRMTQRVYNVGGKIKKETKSEVEGQNEGLCD